MDIINEQERKRFRRFLDLNSGGRTGISEELRTTPLFSLGVKHAIDRNPAKDSSNGINQKRLDDGECLASIDSKTLLPEYGLLGFHVGENSQIEREEPIFMNVNAPNSVFLCGSQGGGKSYTLSCMLENCLLGDSSTGELTAPLTGIVFHYDIDSANSVAEAAYLSSRGIHVNVLVSQSNQYHLQRAYDQLPGARDNITVGPLLLDSADLSVERMHKLMAFSEKEGAVPLYMEVAQRILRHLAVTSCGEPFDYAAFKAALNEEKLSREQQSPLNLRLNLLESFMNKPPAFGMSATKKGKSKNTNRGRSDVPRLFDMRPGTLTVIDLSDPFLDANTVCVLFDVCLSLIQEKRSRRGLVLALDEAHKYLHRSSAAANNFTDRLLTTVREQRHNATRVLIATQEPTLSGKLLDLCSVSIVHRFTSPAWFMAIREHLGGASSMLSRGASAEDGTGTRLFEQIVNLGVGESLVFAPSAFVQMDAMNEKVEKLGASILKMKTRSRLGEDGGASILAVD